jgi:hypothetical protein
MHERRRAAAVEVDRALGEPDHRLGSSSIVSPPSTFERHPSQATATSDSFGWEEITEERRRRELEEVASPQLWEQCESL